MKCFSTVALVMVLLLVGCASSSHRLIAPARPPINPQEVRIYNSPPRYYQEIAIVDATSGGTLFHGTPRGESEALQRLQSEAAKLGANGVLLTIVGDRSSGAIGVGVGGGDVSFGRRSATGVSGGLSGGAPIVQSGAEGIAIYVPNQR
jgi:hypothetical protein